MLEICGYPLRKSKLCTKKYKKVGSHEFCHLHRDKELPQLCTICLSYILENKMKTKCNHEFHRECLSEHILGYSRPVCPNCRMPIENIYAISTYQIGLPLLHIIQRTSKNITNENIRMQQETQHIIYSSALQWIERMERSGQQLVALHIDNFPFEEFVNFVKDKFPGIHIIEEMKMILVCPQSAEKEIVWP